MKEWVEWVVDHPRRVIAAWLICIAGGIYCSTYLDNAIRGSADGIPGSPSDLTMQSINRAFGRDSAFVFTVVVENVEVPVRDARFAAAMAHIERAVIGSGNAHAARHYWNSGAPELLGGDGHSALLLINPRANSFYEAEILVERMRADLHATEAAPGFSTSLTGPVAVFHDLNRRTAGDLRAAERIGVPITLAILLIVFGAPLAAALPLMLAFAAVVMSLAALYILSFTMPVSAFARDAVTMIGFGVGVDYSLFLVARFREGKAQGLPVRQAVVRAATLTGDAVWLSGMTVAAGFLALFLVRIPLMHSLALGGAAVVIAAVAATLTLLPALLSLLGTRIFWPFRHALQHELPGRYEGMWHDWALHVMRRPWAALVCALPVLALFVVPVFHMDAWNLGAKDLPLELEARQGAELLKKNFSSGWLGPIVLAVQTNGRESLWDPERKEAVLSIAQRLSQDRRIGHVGGFSALLDALGPMAARIRTLDDLPPGARHIAAETVSRSGNLALLVLIPREAPESADAMALVGELRRDDWHDARTAGLTVSIAGASAALADFDEELFASIWRVVPSVLAVTFVMLMVLFRSILIPLKATLLNLLSVLAAWGFLVLVFQDGIGAALIGIDPPGGLNAFIVLMLFTILFGLSMDYEVFLLNRISEERRLGADNEAAVARGLARSAGTITSAALIMICVFSSFAFTEAAATQQFGLGLAFAVAIDATLIRIVLVPALMSLFGNWNWWMPRALSRMRIPRDAERRP